MAARASRCFGHAMRTPKARARQTGLFTARPNVPAHAPRSFRVAFDCAARAPWPGGARLSYRVLKKRIEIAPASEAKFHRGSVLSRGSGPLDSIRSQHSERSAIAGHPRCDSTRSPCSTIWDVVVSSQRQSIYPCSMPILNCPIEISPLEACGPFATRPRMAR